MPPLPVLCLHGSGSLTRTRQIECRRRRPSPAGVGIDQGAAGRVLLRPCSRRPEPREESERGARSLPIFEDAWANDERPRRAVVAPARGAAFSSSHGKLHRPFGPTPPGQGAGEGRCRHQGSNRAPLSPEIRRGASPPSSSQEEEKEASSSPSPQKSMRADPGPAE
jgi:hypothetical protein